MSAPDWLVDGASRGCPAYRELLVDQLRMVKQHCIEVRAQHDAGERTALDVQDAELEVIELRSTLHECDERAGRINA